MDSFCRRKGGTGADGARLTLFCTEEGGDCRLKFCNYQDGGERGEGRGETAILLDLRLNI